MKRLILIFLTLLSTPLIAQQDAIRVYQFEIDDNIARPALRKAEKAIAKATGDQYDILILRLNTFGGELGAAEKIRTLLLECPIPTYVFIDPNAASAGALISIACDSIYMSPGASIGAASVVNQEGTVMPDKYQSYMRSLMRATAEKKGRNPLIAEAMVDPDTYVEGISPEGKVLTFTTYEAIKNGFCEAEVNNVAEILQHAGYENYIIEEQELTWIDKIIGFLINPVVTGLLIMCIIGGIYFELQTPGVGFPLILALTAALLYFAPHYLEGLAAHWEILLFILGVVLLMVEIFVTPGFGVLGIIGIIAIFSALVLALIFNIGFDFSFAPPKAIGHKTLLVLTSASTGLLLSIWLGQKLITANTRFGSLSLRTELNHDKGFVAADMKLVDLKGKTGITLTFMRPVGKVEIDGEVYDATAINGLIDKGETVVVVRFENTQLFIDKV